MKYTIFGKPDCSYCDKAKDLLKKFNIPFNYYDISTDLIAKNKILSEGHTTVPQIYFPDGEHLGGFTELGKVMNN